MRTWFTAFLVITPLSWVAAQPPVRPSPPDTPPIIITPQRPGDPIGKGGAIPPDPPGLIIIRPQTSGSTPNLVGSAPASQPTPPSSASPNPPPGPAPPAGQPETPGVFDYWYAAAVEGERIGYLHWTGRQIEKGGMKFLLGEKYQNFTVARFGQLVTIFGEESTVETANGEVTTVSRRQGIGKDQALAQTGVVEGKILRIRGEGAAASAHDTPWPGGVTGIASEPGLFKRHAALKVGETFDYLTYTPQVNRVIKVVTTFEGEESTALWPNTPPRKLRRYISRMEPLPIEGGRTVTLPATTTWCDAATADPLRVEFDFPGLGGRVTFLRTTEAAAKSRVTNPPDLFKVQSIRLDREIPGIHSKASVVYRVVLPRDDDPATAFTADTRQEVKNLDPKAKSFELHVSASHGPVKVAAGQPAPGPEFLGSSFFINWDNAPVKAHTAAATAGLQVDAAAWDKAKAIERWVHTNMKAVDFSQAMATADNVAKTLSGDCTEYAMLAAAMCRAAGVPSRTVLGLVYAPAPGGGKPFLAYHMWFEVYAEGQWVPLDATLGQGGVGPGHVKIAEPSWHNEQSFTPLLPVLRVLMAKPAFEVGRVSP